MNTKTFVLMIVGLVAVGATAAAASGAPTEALKHAADKAGKMASGHSIFHRDAPAEARCDEFRNHGAYVSSVAKQNHTDDSGTDDDNESDAKENSARGRDHANGTGDNNRTTPKDKDDDNASEPAADDGHGAMVREAAHSDIGKCGGPAEKEAGADDRGASADHRQDDAADAGEDSGHGRSDEKRAEHPPRRP